MILLILFGVWFYNLAKKNNLNAVLWAIIGAGSYIVGQLLAGVVVGMFAPSMINDDVALIVIGLFSGLGAVLIAYLFLQQAINNKKQSVTIDDKIIDDTKDSNNSFESRNKIHDDIS